MALGCVPRSPADAVLGEPPSFPVRLTAAVAVRATEVSAAAIARDERRTRG
jgi:hypothetical protein